MGAALLCIALTASAHRGHAVWTDITWAGEGFEIVHRMHLADAITINRYMGGREAIEELRSMGLVALYVEERFKIAADEGGVAKLQTLGAEIEDDFLFVYQEWTTEVPESFPEIDNRLLLDVEPESQALMKILGPGLDEERERR